jgi:tetratricopeptide (TPR) repeat protein
MTYRRVSALAAGLGISLFAVATRLGAQPPAQQTRPAITISGNVRDFAGAPVADASLSLQESGTSAYVSATTKSDGAFSFLVLRPGSYTLRAEKKGFPPATASVLVAEGEKKRIDLVLGESPAKSDSPGPNGAKANEGQANAAAAGSNAPKGSASANMELTDKPSFTVAGVTDYTNVGGHGSDVKLRTSESLAKETAGLKSPEPSLAGANTADAGKSGASTPEAAREADSHRLAGDRAEKSGDLLVAEREYEAAVRLDPSEQNYFAWGTELLLHRASRPAAEIFTKGASLHPTSARMLAGLGAALYANGAYAEAARRVCAASDLQPADPTPYLFLGKMEKAAPDPLPCAAEKLARFSHDDPKNPQANYYFALSLWKRAQRNESAQYIARTGSLAQAAINADPKFAEAYVLLGMVHGAGIDFARAIENYKKAIEINPQLAEAHYRLAQAYKRVGDEANSEKETQLYKEAEKAESDAVERQRREIRQFLIILKGPAQAPLAEQPERRRE